MQDSFSSTSVRHQDLEAAKWAALLAMTVDHYGKIVDPSVFVETHLIGRIAYPLFAGIIAMRLALSPGLVRRYVPALLAWAVVSQPVFVLAGRRWMEGNILFTLLLGVIAWQALHWVLRDRRLGGVLALATVGLLASHVEFGIAGVAMIPATAAVASSDADRALWAIGPFGVAANLVMQSPFLTPVDLFALVAGPIALLSPRLSTRLPRLPKHAFYAYYPLHLYALHLSDRYL